MLFIILNFFTYFGIQLLVTTGEYDLLTFLDLEIPFVPQFIWIYHTLLPVIIITLLFFIQKKELFFSTIIALLLATSILSFFYILFPSFYPREGFVDNSSVSGLLVELTRKIDSAHNTFPSGHVAFAWLTLFFIGISNCGQKNKLIYWGYFIWASLISIATLTLKQHYIVDVFSGVILAYFCFYISKVFFFERFHKFQNHVPPST